MHFAIFQSHLSKVLHLPRKSDARSYEVLHVSQKITLGNLKTLMLQNATPLRKSAPPDLLTSLKNMSVVLPLPREMDLCRSSSNIPRMSSFLKLQQNPDVLLSFGKVQNPLSLPRKVMLERPKVVRNVMFLPF